MKTKKRKNNFLYYFVKITGAIPSLLLLRPRVIYMGEGKKPSPKGAVICANHPNFTDPVLMQFPYPLKKINFLATDELFSSKLKSFFFSRMCCIPVDKQNISMDTVHLLCDKLKAGAPVVIFPEGTVGANEGDEPIGFKSGAALIAFKAGAPIIPMYIIPWDKWYKRRVILIGDPVDIRSMCKIPSIQAIDSAVNTVREKILALRCEYYKSKVKKHDKGK